MLWRQYVLVTPLKAMQPRAAVHLWLCTAPAWRCALFWRSRLRLAAWVHGSEVFDVGQGIRHLPAGHGLRLGQRAGPVFSRRSRRSRRSVRWRASLGVVLGLPGTALQQLLRLLHYRMCLSGGMCAWQDRVT